MLNVKMKLGVSLETKYVFFLDQCWNKVELFGHYTAPCLQEVEAPDHIVLRAVVMFWLALLAASICIIFAFSRHSYSDNNLPLCFVQLDTQGWFIL